MHDPGHEAVPVSHPETGALADQACTPRSGPSCTASPAPAGPAAGRIDRRSAIAAFVCAALFAAFAVLTSRFSPDHHIDPISWLPAALALALLLRARLANEVIVLAALGLTSLLAGLATGSAFVPSAIHALANTAEIIVSLSLIRRACGPLPDMTRIDHFARFSWAGGLIGPLVSSAIAGFATPSGLAATGMSAADQFMNHALGTVVLVPSILLAFDAWNRRLTLARGDWLRFGAVLAVGTSCALFVFSQSLYSLLFLIPPITLLHAFRLGSLGTAIYVLALAVAASAMTLGGTGPIVAATGDPATRVHLLQAFIAANFLTGLPVAAILAERDRIARQLEAGRQQLDLLARTITDAVLRYDPLGGCTYASPSTQDVLETRPDELIGQPITAHMHEKGREDVLAAHARLVSAASERERFTYRRKRDAPDGSPVFIEADCALATDPASGRSEGIIVAARDVTERVELERLLRCARSTAEDATKAKSQFLADMSHELRTPMNGILGFAELMLQSDLGPEERRHANLIVESGRSMMLLLNDILDLSKIEAGEVGIDHAPVDLHATLSDCAALHRPSAEEKGLELDFQPGPGGDAASPPDRKASPWIMTDGLRLRQIVLNLIGNAVKFTEKGGIEISYTLDGSTVRISVTDSGIGIGEAQIETIFQPFAQAGGDTERQAGGTGLGLSISRQLAALLGGRIEVESKPGEGSCFTLMVPATLAAPVRAARPEPRETDEALLPQSARVLLAEDHDINRELVTEMLERCGQSVAHAHDGNEAISMVIDSVMRARPFDLVLMDVRMPGCNGYEATHAIRAEGIGADELPIIALSADVFPEDVARARAAGMQGHLAKPIGFASLARALERWLPTRIVDAAPRSTMDEVRRPIGADGGGYVTERADEPNCARSLGRRWALRREEAVGAVREALNEGWLAACEHDEPEAASLARKLHRLAGTAAMFRESDLGDCAAALEHALAQEKPRTVRERLARDLLKIADRDGAARRGAGSGPDD